MAQPIKPRLDFDPSPITLGTVQFGMKYGIANEGAQPSEAEAFSTMDRAVELGVTTIDTARAYGTAEAVIGGWLASRKPRSVRVVTKVPKIPAGTDTERQRFVTAKILESTRTLGVKPLPLVMVHDETDLLDLHVTDAFHESIASGAIASFGASVYRTDIAARLIADVSLAAIQVPANIIDRRFQTAGIFAAAAAAGITVFVRSVFLQGALLAAPDRLPRHLAPLAHFVTVLRAAARESGRSLSEILIGAVRDIPGATSLVLGVDAPAQLEPHIDSLRAAGLPPLLLARIAEAAASLPPDIVDPSKWTGLAARS